MFGQFLGDGIEYRLAEFADASLVGFQRVASSVYMTKLLESCVSNRSRALSVETQPAKSLPSLPLGDLQFQTASVLGHGPFGLVGDAGRKLRGNLQRDAYGRVRVGR